jgi:HSP20 family molecular chaperone IbpA
VDRDSVEATYRDGVVTVALSKRDGASKKPIRVSIR